MTCYQPHDKTQPRMVRGRHDPECLANAALGDPCEGCMPCAEDHCTVLWLHEDCQTHAPTICPKCLGTTREHLTEIQREMPAELENRAGDLMCRRRREGE